MRTGFYLAAALSMFLLLGGCAPRPVALSDAYAKTMLREISFDALPGWSDESFGDAFARWREHCESRKVRALYPDACEAAQTPQNPRAFFENHFVPYRIQSEAGRLTGYYEPQLFGSMHRSERYRYPVYGVPEDLLSVDLSGLYPDLKHRRLRGRVEGRRLVPYWSRAQIDGGEIDAPVICWVDDRVDLFFLEVQGSGRVEMKDGSSLFLGYADQNGHPYRSVGRYLIDQGELDAEAVSLQSIKAWLHAHPERADEVLHHNPSAVFFHRRLTPATGALGYELSPMRSVAIDPRYVPLGALLYLETQSDILSRRALAFAQDTGGAIRGPVRADLFLGHGPDAEAVAGRLNAPLSLWVLLPKGRSNEELARMAP